MQKYEKKTFLRTFANDFNKICDMKELNYHTMYVGKIEKVLVRDDKYLG